MARDNRDNDAQLLDYPAEWRTFELLEDDLLNEQLQQFARGDDANREHYRWVAFQQLLQRPLTDSLVAHYVQLAALDPDRTLARSALVKLIDHPALTDAQLHQLATLGDDPLLATRLGRARLLRRLRPAVVALALLQECAASGIADVHLALLRRADLDRSLLRQLQQSGANRAIRNHAAERLRSHDKGK